MIRITPQLHQSELFNTLSEEEISRLVPLCSQFATIEDSVLFTEGRSASYLYVVVEGEIALQKSVRVPHGTSLRRTTITICRPGEIVNNTPHRTVRLLSLMERRLARFNR